MITLRSHGMLDPASALVLQYEAPQHEADTDRYIELFPALAAREGPFVLYSDLRGFTLDHFGDVRQNKVAKATRSALSARIRGLILLAEVPTERKRAAFANFWNIPVEVHDDPLRAEAAFRALHARLIARG